MHINICVFVFCYRQLLKATVLTNRTVGSWWLAVPNTGMFMKSLLRGRKAILTMIKKSKYKEILKNVSFMFACSAWSLNRGLWPIGLSSWTTVSHTCQHWGCELQHTWSRCPLLQSLLTRVENCLTDLSGTAASYTIKNFPPWNRTIMLKDPFNTNQPINSPLKHYSRHANIFFFIWFTFSNGACSHWWGW